MHAANTVSTIQQVLWCGLMLMGLEFLFIAARLKDDRTFFLLGASLVLLCLMAGIDIWILIPSVLGNTHGTAFLDFWQATYQILACAYVAASIWLTRLLADRPKRNAAMWNSLIFAAFALAFFVEAILPGVFLIGFRNGDWQTTWAYDWIFTPYIVGAFFWVIYQTIRGITDRAPLRSPGRSVSSAKRALRSLCVAYSLLAISGLLDFLSFWFKALSAAFSYVEFGILAMGIIGTFIFTDRLLDLYARQKRTLMKIAEIHGAVETDSPLRAIGVSATKVTEEIRGYVSMLRADSQTLMEKRPFGRHPEADRIESARRNLESYTTGILEFSGSSRIGVMAVVQPVALLGASLKSLPLEFQAKVRIIGNGGAILADSPKMERAMFEVLKNAMEAGARSLEIRLRSGLGMMSMAIDDDGSGCSRETAERILHPFFTTRRQSNARGLGASIADGIIRAHGGAFRIYPKNGDDGIGGMLANIILPLAEKESMHEKESVGECLLVSDRAVMIEELFSICGNIGMRLSVVGTRTRMRKGFDKRTNPPNLVILDRGDGVQPEWDWNPGGSPSLLYAYGSDRKLRPVLRTGGDARLGSMILCEETLLAFLIG